MTDRSFKDQGTWLQLAAVAFIFAGVASQPIFLAVAIFLMAAAEAKRSKAGSMIIAALGLGFLMLVLAYGVGKDMALRDNAQGESRSDGAGT